ncbi:MAG: bifunctional diaminohydroxyphosphoribosylaminopyrimidine deaminase/5-amino-6-(5-phosphoribosylamino)uracil reductase RibD [Armatimonadetes bacterium]|nr:bifunctional diaminohydroxyphosphoribosylaminopyrimidine deaminase/5-amino-6-(5-phosphoribosylamino)uracil reductase RibD [Armatimonadota bacterium]
MDGSDAGFMREAIELSKQSYPTPNPRVGAVVVRNGQIIGRGFHEAAGLPHAEIVALEQAGASAKGADLFVTLEPCAHHGRTPPCAQAVMEAGIRRVVLADEDPNPAAAGGADMLKAGGLVVEMGFMAEEAATANRVFLGRYKLGRPYVIAKAAITLDGRIATASGQSKWITGPEARKRAHELRAELGCVLIGARTAREDNPSLTVREVAGDVHLRVVLDPERVLEDSLSIFADGEAPTLRVTTAERAQGADLACPVKDGEFDLERLLSGLTELGVIGVLVEGGGATLESFFRQGLVDETELHLAPKMLGSGISWLEGKGVESLDSAWRLRSIHAEALDDGLRIWGEVER